MVTKTNVKGNKKWYLADLAILLTLVQYKKNIDNWPSGKKF
jgi:hypothetical protein